ncbi:MAG: glutamyl-tRNA reductase, partial [Acidobacteria bacterium]|nr:glutamyl-tRNA reductase [Acidobacteriota bacterium]
DPAAGDIEQVFLYNIDDLRSIVQENLARRQSRLDRAELMIDDEVNRFMAWLRSRAAVPTVIALRERFEAVRQAELARLQPKLAGLSPAARARVEEVTRLLVEKLLSSPTERLKATTDEEDVAAYAEMLNHLFKLSEQQPGDGETEPDTAAEALAALSRDRAR